MKKIIAFSDMYVSYIKRYIFWGSILHTSGILPTNLKVSHMPKKNIWKKEIFKIYIYIYF